MSDNLKAMQECGLLPEGEIPTNPVEMFVDHQELKERLEEYTSRILASQQAAHEAEIEPLRAQVAMLTEHLIDCQMHAIGKMQYERNKTALSNTQAIAEQFIAECEQRGAVNALEELLTCDDMTNTGYIHKSAIARRATSKKAG